MSEADKLKAAFKAGALWAIAQCYAEEKYVVCTEAYVVGPDFVEIEAEALTYAQEMSAK